MIIKVSSVEKIQLLIKTIMVLKSFIKEKSVNSSYKILNQKFIKSKVKKKINRKDKVQLM